MIQESDIPNTERVCFRIIRGNKRLALRVPDWTTIMIVKVGEIVKTAESGYIFLEAAEGMEIDIRIPMRIQAYPLHDNKHCIGLKYGPVVLSAGLGTEAMEESKTGVDVTIATRTISIKDFITVKASDGSEYSTEKDVDAWIEDIDKNIVKVPEKLEFSLKGTDSGRLIFTPHYKRYQDRYGIYWNMVSRDSKALQNHIRETKAYARKERVQIDSIPLGNDQYELLHNIQGENTGAGTFNGLMLRHAWSKQGWFSYDIKVKQGVNNYLLVKYFSGNAGRTFNIYIDDVLLKEETIENKVQGEFYEEYYLLPEELIKEKDMVRVKFAVRGDSWVGGIFDKLSIVSDYMNHAGISRINISGGTLNQSFCENITEYTLNMKAEYISFRAELTDKNGLLYVNNVLVDDALERKERVKQGDTVILRAVAEDYMTEKIYTIKIV